jgi:hypothetical protein
MQVLWLDAFFARTGIKSHSGGDNQEHNQPEVRRVANARGFLIAMAMKRLVL